MSVTLTSAVPKSQSVLRNANSSHDERRLRRRAKIAAQVLVRVSGNEGPVEEVCMSVDMSRDGLLFIAHNQTYSKGQIIEVTFPYSAAPGALNHGQEAEVVRVIEQPGSDIAVAVHFLAAKQAAATKKSDKAPVLRTAAPTARAVPGQARQSVVLSVDSDPRGTEAVRTLLEQDGYTLINVTTGQGALEFLRTNVPDVFLAEVETEDISGHDLCVIIKQNERLAGIPVILLTRSAQPADYYTSHQLGAVVCMAKPFQPERLQQVVRLVAPPPVVNNSGGNRVAGGLNRKTA